MKTLKNILREEIQKTGAISFARFMALALYSPKTGYYEKNKNNVGRAGDFITSVSSGNFFGELLAFQFSEWLTEIKNSSLVTRHSSLCLIEAGAHDGKLAADILNWLEKNRPQLFSEINYLILEPSATRQNWQRETLKEFSGKVFWFSDFENSKLKTQNSKKIGRNSVELKSDHLKFEISDSKLNGIIFSNELLDAFPVQRFGWNAKEKRWFEFGVAIENENFVWTKIQNSKLKTQNSELNLPPELLEVLPDGYVVEISKPAKNWWSDAAKILERGKLLTIDYGYGADEQFLPARTNGTLRAYFRQHFAENILANPGEQDLTAHVDFSAIQKAGEAAGLKTEFFGSQPKFLTQILQNALRKKNDLKNSGENNFVNLTASQVRQFQTLTHPEHLGRAFKVLVQCK